MRKLIIAIGIVAAILAFLISFRAKGQLQVIGRTLNLNNVISRIALEDRIQYVYEVVNFGGFDVGCGGSLTRSNTSGLFAME